MKQTDSILPSIDAASVPITSRLRSVLGKLLSKNSQDPEPYEDAAELMPLVPSDAADCLDLPIKKSSTDYDERLAFQAKGQFLARQEDWDILAKRIIDADQSRAKTANGAPIAELLAYGARDDVVRAAEHALFDGAPAIGAQMRAGLDALETVLLDHPESYPVAMVVALAYLDVGLAWRGNGWLSILSPQNKDAFGAHIARAHAILDPFRTKENVAPSLLAARCALLAEGQTSQRQIADKFEVLIDLDPTNFGNMRALGSHLLPLSSAAESLLDLEARRTAARTQNVWGAGAYAWVCFDAILMSDAACAQIDTSFFIEGLRDILARSPDQHTANLLAAYCSLSIRSGCGGDDAADLVRHQVMECATWIIRDHLTEIHPLVWAQAAGRFDTSTRSQPTQKFAESGRRDALDAISALFGDRNAPRHSLGFSAQPFLGAH